MAQLIPLKHRETGEEKEGIYGFSWTILFFGALPVVIRRNVAPMGYYLIFGDLILLVGEILALGLEHLPIAGPIVNILRIICVIASPIVTIFQIICAFEYNKYYTNRLLESGYQLSGSEQRNAAAAEALGITAQAYSINRKCPFCAEYVKAEASVCRFCQKDLPRLDASRSELSQIRTDMDRNQAHADQQKQLLDRLGVEQRDGLFYYHGKGYHSLSDIPFGKK
jgi:hypothetical protein